MSDDRNEALRLADELAEEAERRVCHVAMAPASLLKEAAALLRQLSAERDQLRAEVERLRAAMTVPTIEPNSQNWQGMDGAIAFHLIERHADSWADAGRMMREWLEANAIDHARTTHKDEG